MNGDMARHKARTTLDLDVCVSPLQGHEMVIRLLVP